MSALVSFLDKSGKPCRATFPSRTLADAYAKGLRLGAHAKVWDLNVTIAPVAIVACPEGTADMVKDASRTYAESWKDSSTIAAGQTRTDTRASRESRDNAEENRAERMAEHFGAAAAAGQCQEDAWKDWDYSEGY